MRRARERTGSVSVQDLISLAVTGRDSSMLRARRFSPGVGTSVVQVGSGSRLNTSALA